MLTNSWCSFPCPISAKSKTARIVAATTPEISCSRSSNFTVRNFRDSAHCRRHYPRRKKKSDSDISGNPDLMKSIFRSLRFHQIQVSGDLDFIKSPPAEVCILVNPGSGRFGFHEIQFRRVEFMKVNLPELCFS